MQKAMPCYLVDLIRAQRLEQLQVAELLVAHAAPARHLHLELHLPLRLRLSLALLDHLAPLSAHESDNEYNTQMYELRVRPTREYLTFNSEQIKQ